MLIASEVDGFACRMNDCVCDSKGRFLAGSNFYNPSTSYELGKLFLVDNNSLGTMLAEGFHLANGLAFSPDYTGLYSTDSVARVIYGMITAQGRGIILNRHTRLAPAISTRNGTRNDV